MTTLNPSYDFSTLIGQPEDWNKAQQNFADIKAWANGNIDETNMPASSGLFAAYRSIRESQGTLAGGTLAAGYFFSTVTGGLQASGVAGGSGGVADNAAHSFYFDAADYAMSGKTLKLRLRAQCYTNATPPAVTFTFGLYPISSVSGGSGVSLAYTLGTVVSGSQTQFVTPGANQRNAAATADFTAPSAGHYVLAVFTNATMASGSCAGLHAQLQAKWT